jgi:hypothetical protein
MFYHVEFKRTSWINLRIEADSPEEAEKLAWEEIETDGSYGIDHADWYCNGVYKEKE